MKRNGNDRVDAACPNSSLVRHPRAERPAKVAPAFVLEAPDGVGGRPAIFEHRSDAMIVLDRRIAGATKDRLLQIGHAVARSTPPWRDQIEQPREDGVHAPVSTKRVTRCDLPLVSPSKRGTVPFLVVVGFAAEDCEASVDLFGENEAS